MNCLPNLYVPGFPKSATTSISSALAQHSSIFAPVSVEPHFWAKDLPFYAAREGLESISAYQSLYRRATEDQRWRLDGSTLYLYSEVAVRSIVQNVADARFIVCLRPPEEIVLAWHMQMVAGGYESEQDPERAFNLSAQRRQQLQVPKHCPDAQLLDYERVASVGTQLCRLISIAGINNVHVVTMNSVKDAPQKTLESIWNFLSIPNAPDIALGKSNSAFAVRHLWLRRSIYHPNVKPYVTKALNSLPTQAAERTRDVIRKLMYQKASRTPPSDTFNAFLHEFFSEERRLLRNCLPGVSGATELDDDVNHK